MYVLFKCVKSVVFVQQERKCYAINLAESRFRKKKKERLVALKYLLEVLEKKYKSASLLFFALLMQCYVN